MSRLLAVCPVRVLAIMAPADDIFSVYDAADAIKDADTIAVVRSSRVRMWSLAVQDVSCLT